MSETFHQFELSSQILDTFVPASQAPKHEGITQLAELAPKYAGYSEWAEFPISNDPCTGTYFEQLQVRAATQEYAATENPVALLIGESALAANLRFIPEPTILMTDYSPGMCDFLTTYIDSLRSANSRLEWVDTVISSGNQFTIGEMRFQDMTWNESGYTHPFSDDEAFKEAQALARDKVIVPWNLDITLKPELEELGQRLKTLGAAITFMNFTNVIPFVYNSTDSRGWAEHLSVLPITSNAPILTTTLANGETFRDAESTRLAKMLQVSSLEHTGPFFGLDNLGRAQTGFTYNKLGTIIARRYASDAIE